MHLKTLGGLELSIPSAGRTFQRPKPLLLLAYLALEGHKERHHLAELFWPEARRPLDSLRVALSQLRSAVPGVLSEIEGPGASVRVGTTLSCDALELLEALAQADSGRAFEVYTGEFLAGFYLREMGAELEEWVLATREHVAGSLQSAYLSQAESLAADRAFAAAGRLAASALELVPDPDPELLPRLHRLLLAAAHPLAAALERRAAAYDIEFDTSSEAARTALAASAQRITRHNLPSRLAPFVGRDTELVTLINLLTSGSRLVTVTGVGGVGKSRLALEAATALVRDGLFPDGVLHVELAPVADPRLVLAAVAAVVDPRGGADVGALAGTVGDKRMVLLLDNFEHVTAAGPQLSKLLESCPGLTVLVTSRRPLALAGEQLFHLAELVLPRERPPLAAALALDAVRLFQTVARRARLSFMVDDATIDDTLEICRLVHGLPLGIELAATWVGRLSLTELCLALRRGSDGVLTGPRDAAPRQRSLRATIEHSWGLLSDNEARALTALAAFRGGFTWEGAARVAGASIVTLRSLGARSLLSVSADGRYDTHPLVAEYARERLQAGADNGATALQAHAEYFVDLARDAEQELKTGDQAGTLWRLDADLANLHAAAARLVAQARLGSLAAARAALDLSGSLWQYWLRRGRLSEGRDLAEAALAVAPAAELPLERAKALTGAAVLASVQGDEHASEAYNRQALALRRAAGDRAGEARSLYNLAASAGRAGDLGLAEGYLTSAIDAFRELGDEWSLAFALFNLSTLARSKGHFAEAAAHLAERLRLQLALGDEARTAETYVAMGIIGLETGALDAAEGSFEKALEVLGRLHNFQDEAEALEGLALVAFERGRLTDSDRFLQEARMIREEHDIGPSSLQRRLAELHGGG